MSDAENNKGHSDDIDHTVVAPRGAEKDGCEGEAPDHTVVAPRTGSSGATEAGAGAGTIIEADDVAEETRAVVRESASKPRRPTAGAQAPPVEEPKHDTALPQHGVGAPPLFKSPLDPKRRVREAPATEFEKPEPKGGVRPGLPVVYPAAYAGVAESEPAPSVRQQRIGPPPKSVAVVAADRTGLPSTERANRKFGRGVVLGFAGAIIVSVAGLSVIAMVAFG